MESQRVGQDLATEQLGYFGERPYSSVSFTVKRNVSKCKDAVLNHNCIEDFPGDLVVETLPF